MSSQAVEKVQVAAQTTNTVGVSGFVGVASAVVVLGGGYLIAKKLGLLDPEGKGAPAGDEKINELIDKVNQTIVKKNLTRDAAYYEQLAINQYEYLNAVIGAPLSVNENVFNEIQYLNVDELKQVYVNFGFAERKLFEVVITIQAGNLFQWYTNILNQKNQDKMKTIWAKTGLWVTTEVPKTTVSQYGYQPLKGDRLYAKKESSLSQTLPLFDKPAFQSAGGKLIEEFATDDKNFLTVEESKFYNTNWVYVRWKRAWYLPDQFGYTQIYNAKIVRDQSLKGLEFNQSKLISDLI